MLNPWLNEKGPGNLNDIKVGHNPGTDGFFPITGWDPRPYIPPSLYLFIFDVGRFCAPGGPLVTGLRTPNLANPLKVLPSALPTPTLPTSEPGSVWHQDSRNLLFGTFWHLYDLYK
jgi:hypothetical protein